MLNRLKIIPKFIVNCLALPCHCILCLQSTERDIALCYACEKLLPWLGFSCCYCSLPLEKNRILCYNCLARRPSFERLQALFAYRKPVSSFVGKLKFSGQLHFAKVLGNLMAENLTPFRPVDCIIPVPLHLLRQQKRGFNQALEIATIVANKHKIPLNKWCCTKKISTAPQSTLTAIRRANNISVKSFSIAPTFKAKHVLIIDDVVTTGATVEALTVALKNAGVLTVEVWACCRTL